MQLTEQDILARSNKYNLADIDKLNISGCGLTDVSILENLPNLQVLILSQNHIKTLKQLQKCFRLHELYLRSNDIQDFDELIYLKNLPLRRLVLAENPCSKEAGENYRVNVIKMLPFLESFDNQIVSREELEQALNLRILKRNLEGQKVANHLSPSSDAGLLCADNMELSNEPQRFNMNSDMATGGNCPDALQNSKSPDIFSRPRLCSEQHGAEHISLPDRYLQHERYICDNVYNSVMDFSEWERRSPCQDHHQPKYNRLSASNFMNDRAGPFRYADPIPSQRYESPDCNPISARTERSTARGQLDDESNGSDRNSSVASTYRGKLVCPKSRRVNLLCASLRFVLELDVLSLVDLLSIVRGRIHELYSSQ